MKYKKLLIEFTEKFDEFSLYIKRNRSDKQPIFQSRLLKFISELEGIKKKYKLKEIKP